MDPEQVVQGQVEAFNARDVERFLGYYREDAVLEDGAGHVLAQGRAAIRALYGPLFAQSPDLHAEVVRRIVVGPWVIDEERGTGANLAGFPPELHVAVVYRVEDGTIVSARSLF